MTDHECVKLFCDYRKYDSVIYKGVARFGRHPCSLTQAILLKINVYLIICYLNTYLSFCICCIVVVVVVAAAARLFKVTDFGTNRNLIYDFLLVINTTPIFHRFQVMADYSSNFR